MQIRQPSVSDTREMIGSMDLGLGLAEEKGFSSLCSSSKSTVVSRRAPGMFVVTWSCIRRRGEKVLRLGSG